MLLKLSRTGCGICLFLFIGYFFFFSNLKAEIADTTRLSLTQINDYYQFQGKQNISWSHSKLLFQLKSDHNLRYYSARDGKLRTKTENNYRINLIRNFKLFSTGFEYNNYTLKDKFSGISNDYNKNQNGLFLQNNKKNIKVSGGKSFENRQQQNEDGWYAGFNYNSEKNISLKPRIQLFREKYANRNNFLYNLSYVNKNKIGDYAYNRFLVSYKEIGREYYISTDLSTEKRLNINRQLQNGIRFKLPNRWDIRHNINYLSDLERLNFDENKGGGHRDRTRFHLFNKININKNFGPFVIKTEFDLIQEQNQYYSTLESYLSPTDYSLLRKDLHYKLLIPMKSADSLALTYHVSLYQFTTPDSLNYDDRDELSHTWQMSFQKNLSPMLRIFANARIHYRHLLYLSEKRSARNHVNRIYSIDFGQNFFLSNTIRINGSQRIFANYYIYDYEHLFPINYSSMVFRGLKISESVTKFLSKRFSVSANSEFRFEEDGFMNWEDFIKQKTIDRNYLRSSISFNYQGKSWQIESGPFYHIRKDKRVINGESETILDPQRIGWNVKIKYASLFIFHYSLEDLSSGGEHQRWQQQGKMMVNFVF